MRTTAPTCIGAIVLLLPVSDATAVEVVGPELSVTKTEHLTAEPVSLTLTWTNRSEEAAKFDTRIAHEYSTIVVSVDDGGFREFVRTWRLAFQSCTDTIYRTVTLDPGESYSIAWFIVRGLFDKSDEQFLLFRPGRYTLRANPDDKYGVNIEARAPTNEQDRQALDRWRNGASWQFQFRPYWIAPDFDSLNGLIREYPDSVYAQYARLAAARHLVDNGSLREKEEVMRETVPYLEPLLRDRKNPVILEQALWLLAATRRAVGEEANHIADRIERVNPKSEYLKLLRMLGSTSRQRTGDTRPLRKDRWINGYGWWGKETKRLLGGVALLGLSVGAAVWLRRRKRTSPRGFVSGKVLPDART